MASSPDATPRLTKLEKEYRKAYGDIGVKYRIDKVQKLYIQMLDEREIDGIARIREWHEQQILTIKQDLDNSRDEWTKAVES
ncbi:uncharacterized protein KY384_000798 [Bacidia gigantensis]|uniref:uncharacterized protein n=1 Tax=Bacidia gigantensis TaxID=2732470 RepID=UPI001D03BC8B|nr:uncharacterized protein KY384_000798 [Bacidia gigantensis]KAG8526036.1 hypothetical protein KY384_000798 [Bacidia gigantensis]